jgi:transporter family-2 protein
LTSLAIDHFGLMNMPTHSLNVWRIVGAAFMAVGIAFISLF